ncbi:ADP-heptose:LPS heptosyltransferase [Nonlabens dokdonensis]|uniref:Uncharacterized protein n=2 Tax=Nonlabens dokdonensis TaxID=328515 RepID=L7W667_NONDD|nr:hypothetical protein [Nonlabens dokdonensis]AGC75271.1 hypothetical protein DDD_0144 [Nonlabens dokdonensis DSW-6]PZX38992.1 ADP-heptose:LPS heptosyltransferase [Nonlabens dokdonensis]
MKYSQITYNSTLRQINDINNGINRGAPKVLINYKAQKYFIGDSVVFLTYLKLIRNYFFNSKITINLHHRIDIAILQHNPYVDERISENLSSLNFIDYDLIIAVGSDKDLFTEIVNNYSSELQIGNFKTGVFSLTDYLKFDEEEYSGIPNYHKLFNFIRQEQNNISLKKEIFILDEEIEWADEWLRQNGVKPHEKVIIIIDSASLKEKLLTIEVHFKMIEFFLENESNKLLVFDENGIGKLLFYNEWLGAKYRDRLIFANELKFRHELSLLSSNYVKFVFGPCTGIMHCASAIHNVLAMKYKNTKERPGIMVYAGEDAAKNQHKSQWWSDDEEAKCCVLKYVDNNRKEILWINPNVKDYLLCSEYTPKLLQNAIKDRFLSVY